jgi:hypothetical protein
MILLLRWEERNIADNAIIYSRLEGIVVLIWHKALGFTFERSLSAVLLSNSILFRSKSLLEFLLGELVIVHAVFARKKISDQTSDFHYKLPNFLYKPDK